MINEQFKKCMSVFLDIYGAPNWSDKQKTSNEWSSYLQDYNTIQVEEACYKCIKYGKITGFPTLTHLKSNLFDQPKLALMLIKEQEYLTKQEIQKKQEEKEQEEKEARQRENIEYLAFIKTKGYSSLLALIKAGKQEFDIITKQFNERK